jgi:hypothetical protein
VKVESRLNRLERHAAACGLGTCRICRGYCQAVLREWLEVEPDAMTMRLLRDLPTAEDRERFTGWRDVPRWQDLALHCSGCGTPAQVLVLKQARSTTVPGSGMDAPGSHIVGRSGVAGAGMDVGTMAPSLQN